MNPQKFNVEFPFIPVEADSDEMLETVEDTRNDIKQTKETTEIDKDRIELPNEGELYEIDDELEWLREQDETELPELSEENEVIELGQTIEELAPEHIETAETLADQEPIEQPAVETNESVPTDVPIEETVDLEPEQLADLEHILDQIEPIEPIGPIETEPLHDILPEALEEPEVIEGEAY